MAKGSKSALFLIFITVFIDLLGFGIVLPLLPRYATFYQATPLTLGLLMASFSAMQFLFAPVWGRLSDRIGRRPVLILGLMGSCVSYALFGIISPLGREHTWLGIGVMPWLFITRIGAGIAGATIPTAQAYIADNTGPNERARGMALIGAAFGIGFCLGPLFGAAFVSDDPNAAPSAYPGYAAAVLSGLALLFAIVRLPESLQPESASAVRSSFLKGLLKLGQRPQLQWLIGCIFLTTFSFAQFETTLSLFTKHLGLSDRSNFYVFAYIGFILLLAQGWLVRKLVPKWGESRMALTGVVLMAAGLALVAGSGQLNSIPVLIAVLPVCVVGFAALTPSLQAMLSKKCGSDEQGEILGFAQSASALARICGPVAGYSLTRYGVTVPYWAGAGLLAISFVLLTQHREPAPTATPSAE